MKPREILRLFERESIPLFDIREVLSFLGSSLDRAEIDEKDIEDNRVFVVLAKLKEGYPVSYLVGHVDLLSLRILLDENVLIPRTETEDFLADFLSQKNLNGKRVLDLCTGSGFIALAVKKRYPHADVVASDISKAALSLAERSAKLNGLSVRFVHSDYLDDIDGTFDIILSNPPYIPLNSPKACAPYEPKLALYSGKDGMDSYRRIFPKLISHLSKDGVAYFEIESDNAEKIKKLAQEEMPGVKTEILRDFDGKERFIRLFFDN